MAYIPGAAAETAVNAGCIGVLANAVLSWDQSGTPTEAVGILHDLRDAPDAVDTPRAHRGLVFEMAVASLGQLVPGKAVAVRGLNYTVGAVERDRAGWAIIKLRSANT